MKKLAIVLLLVAAGCRRQVAVGSPAASNVGGSTPREAVQRFMGAAKAQDLQAMAQVWGTSSGPAIKTMDQDVRDQREIILMCYLKHDSYQVLGEAPAAAGERVLALELKLKDLTRPTNFYAVRGPEQRWFVRTFDVEPLRDLCARR